ncbi:phosphonate ABC transporter ATP-binding protein [Microbacterium paludicola]|uniref:Phosphonate ABC transporter ATP-binding protein n=1 Tax=Microbacterium paludicola TaxID=300019 RepID=A0A4Y9FUS5_9MICO|nr:phosphonate ABC transporter ATP-binding protein [Microbacterium paludicola]MBF0816318.1 phosphonate ABC transporter ATP-binding protein [Microbacterium paludicola]TFU32983.1 phosphonate ABC transporter ATP-binding protein [Microbacterium paludicola]
MTNSDTPTATAVQITDLGKTYPGATGPALTGVSLSVAPGEIVVLLGLSGSGKSTLLRHINGLETPSTGSVVSLGHDVASLKGRALRELRGRVGFIFQQFELVGPLTVLENVLTGALSTLGGPRVGLFMYPKSLREKALGHLDRVGLLERAYQRADTLSGGQQQRVAIARALMQDPDILLADEPVASLDPESSSQVMALIREIAAERGLTVVCSLHQVDLALSWGDRIVGLRAGEVVLDMTTENLTREQVMEIYGRVATTTAEIDAVTAELAEAREQVLAAEIRRNAGERLQQGFAEEDPS